MNLLQKAIQILAPRRDRPATGSVLAWAPALKNERSVLARITRSYIYKADMHIQALDSAIAAAEDPRRPDRRVLYAMYKEALDDAQLSAAIMLRIEKVLAEPFVLVGEGEVGSRFDSNGQSMLHADWFYRFCRYALESRLWGHSLIEFEARQGTVLAADLVWREYVRPEYGDILLDTASASGIPYREGQLSRTLLEIGDRDDLGLLKKAARYVILKRYSITDWARRSERYGIPFLVVRTSTTDEKELKEKAKMAAEFGSNAWAILDDQDQIELKESFNQSPHIIFQTMANQMDEYISKLILGQTMTTDDGSSLSQAQVHERVLNSIVHSDMRWMEFIVNDRLIPFLSRLGVAGLDGRKFQYYIHTDEAAAAAAQAAAAAAAAQGRLAAPGLEKKNSALIRRISGTD